MSGIEILGVVMGALPLITSIIDQYRVSKRIYKVFRYKEPYIDQLIQSLKTQSFFLETDLLLILKETFGEEFVRSIPDFAQISPTLFENPEVAARIQEYLGDGYAHYRVAVLRCEDILAGIAKNIGGLVSGKQTLHTLIQAYPRKNGSYELTRKIKFALDRDSLQTKISNLDDATKMLSRIRENSSARTGVVIHSNSLTGRRSVSSFDIIRKHAWRLYAAISTIYTNGCHPEHGANLFLESRAELLDRKHRTTNTKPVTFKLSFGPASQTGEFHSPLALEVKALAADPFSDTPSRQGLQVPCISQKSLVNTPRVSYDTTVSRGNYRSSSTAINTSTHNQAASEPSVVGDLCLHLSNKTELQHLLLCENSRLWCHQDAINPTLPQSATPNTTVFSLDQLLQATSPIKLLLNPRMALSFSIASSVMQLNFTQWLHHPLTSAMVKILPDSPSKRGSGIRPFISHTFSPNSEEPKPCLVRRAILELGILLLELWHSQPFTTYAAEANVSLDDCFAVRYEAARRWLDASRDDVLPHYLTVVTRCVECTFFSNTADLDWDDEAFRQSFFEHVVKPLWENCPASLR
ncbi:unnamed protein product [Penicillium salamii]|uniref:DUF7580 domain-containing protein n=1 Tax=Penicillium salamii TaxID=1612424 RepID=A0A9W4IPR9_9EURO|nr:unnamed protein product [Penicillium salamii]CAG8330576.1 unnamed protein product [Penicillium salamii]CAG8339256.1 unnamed protein product [Penicillium salamii]CAG8372813.1 unnamed protein product [Penicillium salamii]